MRKNIKNKPYKVVDVSTSKTSSHTKCHFVGIDISKLIKHEDIMAHDCDVPHANHTDYQLIDIAEDGFMSSLTESGGIKDGPRLPSDEKLST